MNEELTRTIGLRHLRCFVAVAEAGSFAAAAARLHVAPSALSATIRRIETETGVALFDRTTRRVVLTRHGAEFLTEARHLLRGVTAALASLRAAGGLERGSVAVTASPSIVSRLLPAVVRSFHAAHPSVSVTLRDDGAEGIGRRVAEGSADFGIGSEWDLGGAELGTLDYRKLFRDRFGIVCRPNDPIVPAAHRELPWSALAGRDLVGLAADTGIQRLLARHRGLKLPPEPALTVSNTLGQLAMVEAGLGLAVMPESAATLAGAERLRFIPLTRPVVWREICLITRQDRSLSPAARAFRDIALRRLREAPLAPGVEWLA